MIQLSVFRHSRRVVLSMVTKKHFLFFPVRDDKDSEFIVVVVVVVVVVIIIILQSWLLLARLLVSYHKIKHQDPTSMGMYKSPKTDKQA